MRFGIVVSRFNENITSGLLAGAKSFLEEQRIELKEQDLFYVPGAFEIPLVAKVLAKKNLYQGIICLGCVIKGETAHFEYISSGASMGIMQAMLQTDIPVSFGILTTYDEDQAFARSRMNAENKGREAAAACLETARILEKL